MRLKQCKISNSAVPSTNYHHGVKIKLLLPNIRNGIRNTECNREVKHALGESEYGSPWCARRAPAPATMSPPRTGGHTSVRVRIDRVDELRPQRADRWADGVAAAVRGGPQARPPDVQQGRQHAAELHSQAEAAGGRGPRALGLAGVKQRPAAAVTGIGGHAPRAIALP